jgi:SAM-dependent MidA family methyltransferase
VGRGRAVDAVAARIRRHGPIPLHDVVSVALYDEQVGFFATGGAAGRRTGDFITSPEVGPLFGAVVANALDEWWRGLGAPDPFVVVDAGAGAGTLAKSVLLAAPECLTALTYVLVERSAALRARHADHLDVSLPSVALGPQVNEDDPTERGTGPRLVSLAELPRLSITGVVLANELLDNLPFHLLERRAGAWLEVRVALDTDDRTLTEVLVPAPDPLVRDADVLVPNALDGARIPIQTSAAEWLRDTLALMDRGHIVVIDYASTTPELADRPLGVWLRTYREHERGRGVLDDIGDQDITVDVCVDQLARVRVPAVDVAQADWLRAHGIDELVEDGRRIWHERAHLGDLEAVRARSRVREAEALTDRSGLGAFRVLEWMADTHRRNGE